jgi:hypothetical protein
VFLPQWLRLKRIPKIAPGGIRTFFSFKGPVISLNRISAVQII